MKPALSLLLWLAVAGVPSCVSTGGFPAPVKPETPVSYAATIYLTGEPVWRTLDDVRQAIGPKGKLTGNKLDLEGCALSGKRMKHPKNRQDEKAVPLRILIDGFTLKNGVVKDIPGGIVVRADSTRFENLIFVDIGEDALSTTVDAAEEIVVKRSRFYNRAGAAGGDKALQLNDARDAVVEGCFFTGGITAIRVQESSAKAKEVTAWIRGNEFRNVPTAVNVDGPTTVRESGNAWQGVTKRWVTGSRARVVSE